MSEKNVKNIKWMKRAIHLASLGDGKTSPNPMVGAVILDKNGNIISEGFHFKAGMPHAEAMAFNNLKKDATGGSMYVNLEPCCHQGKTPPCVDKIISSGIKKIYVSIKDPDKRVSGKGIKLLKEAGIQVHLGLCKKESLELNKAFVYKNITDKTYGVLKWAMSIDGNYSIIKMTSGEVRKIDSRALATIGVLSNPDQKNIKIGKAGRSRWLGRRPHTRGVVKNPVDHPHGGGEGKSAGGRHPVSPTGQSAKGLKTRDNKRTDKFIIRRRKKKRA